MDKNAHSATSEQGISHMVMIKSKNSQETCVHLRLGYLACTSYYSTVKGQTETILLSALPHTTEDHKPEKTAICEKTHYLFCKKRRLVSSISRFISSAPHWFHVWNSHPKNRQLVGFTSQRTTSGYHIRQFGDVLCHLISSAPLNFTVILPDHLEKHQTNRKADRISVRISIRGNKS